MSAIFEIYMVLELFLSGRLVPMQLMPAWVQTAADYLPFTSTFFFPTQALAGPITDRELLVGLARQVAWCAIGAGIVSLGWKRAVRRYTAVGI
jgi:ABC-2 type transport system permease protein